ncbi:serine/threonine-protein phosphatase [Streptomyces sp. WAC05374]|uniref:PP2C family protein-serine/threonine phosphatase n=1 Tax=Streptomyces sp. WAC05374 TaxID=2487420 RepID=UPI000F869200|nr:PP2C family protein-serine/threonine phosphatase [Streptomyces sp. WAC05374]RST12283.1 serine/threonine-protein phosphatase [Streptomyces sp. WAC05374]TDF36169.1 serine/threonine-protein phosphatase [Streptomyces sp. WAC05374]TDF45108.1 serine/threonine-protein phosphatase [Streptomyces sp. WAC05374]TDF56735.1 serine/threonine-protein phosphatase [Streptomyces sp. WAC05374]
MGQRGRDDGGGREGARRFVRALPALLIAGGVAYDLSTPPRFTAAPLFAAAPLVAAPLFAVWATLLSGSFAVLAVLFLHLGNGTLGEVQALTEILTVVVVAALALLINRVVRRSGERLASARVIAETAQRAVLPTPAERIGGLQVAARYEAAQEDAFIGGDLFAVQDTPYGVRLVVGDVRGKGLGAVEAVAVVIGAFREAAEQESSLEGVAQRLERALAREGTRRDGLDAFEGFTTAVLAEVVRGEAVVRVVDRGHPEPLMLYADGSVALLEQVEPALPLGMAELGAWPDRAFEVPFPAGATLLLYTDGLSEARDAAGVFYDPVARLSGRLFPGPDAVLDALVSDVRRYTGGGATDDLALLAVSRPAEGQPERRRTMPVVP